MARRSKNKESVRKSAKKEGRKMLWKCDEGYWHAAKDKDSVPHWASEVEEV